MKYYKRIDGLRFIAISFVLFQHFARFLVNSFNLGYYGVDLFFVISGFLITSILLKPNEKPFKSNYINFIGRRTIRIFPIYYLTIFTLWLLNLDVIRNNLFWFLTYTYNYAYVLYNVTPSSPANPFWSLSVEEQFYLFWPFIVLFLRKKQILLLIIVITIVIIGYSQIIFNIFPSISRFNEMGLLTRMSSLGLGALGAVASRRNLLPDKLFQSKTSEVLFSLLLIISLIFQGKFTPLLIGICFLFVVLKAAYYDFTIIPVNRFLENKSIIKIGRISYGIYIFHMPIAYYFSKFIFDPIWANINFAYLGKLEKIRWHSWIIKLPLYSFLSIFIASLSFKYIEIPILKLKDKFFKY
jgi:peptidoglycan/LPS O-acetylase OafA/YrhL